MVIKLYAAPHSTASLRVAQILHEKAVPFEFHEVDLRAKENKRPEYLAKSPFGQVPYIDDNGFILYESRAIGRYIALKYAALGTQGLIPDQSNLEAYAQFEQAASSEFAQFEVHAAKIAYELLFKVRIGLPTNEEVVKEAVTQLNAKLDAYEAILSKRKYLAGDLAGKGSLIVDRPNVANWVASLVERPSWVAIKDGITGTA